VNGETQEEVLDDERRFDPVLDGVGVFDGIFYKDNEEKS
jgi:hypothetical protein